MKHKKDTSRHSIATTVTHRVSVLLLCALALLFFGAYAAVYKITDTEKSRLSRTVVSTFADVTVYSASLDQVPIDEEHADLPITYGDYFCKWYAIDSAFVYVPDPEHGTVRYVCMSCGDDRYTEELENHLIGKETAHEFSPAELAVWRGDQTFARLETKNRLGHEICTIVRGEDAFGNRFIFGVETSLSELYRQIGTTFLVLAAVILAVLLGVDIAVFLVIRRRVSRPARVLSRRMNDFITDGRRTPVRLEETGAHEYAMIASAFNRMTENIDSYLESIGTLSREQERQKTEIDIASRIQQGFLPAGAYKTDSYELHAVMLPARDIGGDLYDYLPLDGGRILLVIADVSGKGISAAIFMAVTLILIRQFARMEADPSEILQRTNDTLASHNAEMLFATAFVGIYDPATGDLTFANAGHNPPRIIGNGVRIPDVPAGLLLGLYEGEEYPQTTVHLQSGETLFLYTDGVNEMTDRNRNFFGNERLMQVLSEYRASCGTDLINYVRRSLDSFSDGGEQHDDITMLTLTAGHYVTLMLQSDLSELERIRAAILKLPIPREDQLELCLAAEEMFVNICSYAFEETDIPDRQITFTLTVSDRIEMRLEDNGQPFDPRKNAAMPKDYDPDLQLGGLGTALAFSAVDGVDYRYSDGKNILTFTKYFKEESK